MIELDGQEPQVMIETVEVVIDCPVCRHRQAAVVTARGRGVMYCAKCHRRIDIAGFQAAFSGPLSGFGLPGPSEHKATS